MYEKKMDKNQANISCERWHRERWYYTDKEDDSLGEVC